MQPPSPGGVPVGVLGLFELCCGEVGRVVLERAAETGGVRCFSGLGYRAGWKSGGITMSAFRALLSIIRSTVDVIGM